MLSLMTQRRYSTRSIDNQANPFEGSLFMEVLIDEGIKGLGESSAWGWLEPSAPAVESEGGKSTAIQELLDKLDFVC